MWETRNTNDGGRGNIKEHKGTRDYFIPGLGGQAAASLLAAAFASPSCIHVERGEGWGVSTGQIRGEQLESHSRHPGHKAHRDGSLELWRLLRVSDCVRVQAMGREERRRRSAARRPGSGWVGPLECQESTGCPFLPSGILPRTRNGKCGLLAHSLRNDGKDGSLLRHSRQNSVKSSSLAVRPDTFQLLPGMLC
jgi:hypothetical protein